MFVHVNKQFSQGSPWRSSCWFALSTKPLEAEKGYLWWQLTLEMAIEWIGILICLKITLGCILIPIEYDYDMNIIQALLFSFAPPPSSIST